MSSREIPLEPIEVLRVQLVNERVSSAKEAVTSATLLQQIRQVEWEVLLASLNEKYKSQIDGQEIKGFNFQTGALLVGPKAPEPQKAAE